MIIFLQRIPAETKQNDIIEFIEPALKGRWFNKAGFIKNINIMILRDIVVNKMEYHALVTIEPDSVGERVIRQLNRKPIVGKRIAVREYMHRSWHNDPRMNIKNKSFGTNERRKGERRRGNKLEVVDNFTATFSARNGFQRRY